MLIKISLGKDDNIKAKLDLGIRAEDQVEREGKSLSKLKRYISSRIY